MCGGSVVCRSCGLSTAGPAEVLRGGALGLTHACIGRRDRIDGLAVLKSHVTVVVEHAHRGFQVHKLDGVDAANFFIRGLLHQDKLVELFCCRVLRMAQDLSYIRSKTNLWLVEILVEVMLGL